MTCTKHRRFSATCRECREGDGYIEITKTEPELIKDTDDKSKFWLHREPKWGIKK